MKKQLLALAVAVTTAFAGMAESVAFVAQGASYTGGGTKVEIPTGDFVGTKLVNGDITIELEKKNNSTSNVTSSLLRWYQGDILHITPANGATVTDITVYAPTSYSNNKTATMTLNSGEASEAKTAVSGVFTYTGSFTDEITLVADKQVRISALEITYTPGVADAVAAPEFGELTLGEWSAFLPLTCATEGAEIYYTTNNTEPTKDAMKYTAPIELYSGRHTVKAIAYNGEEASKVATKVIDVPYILDSFSALAGMDEGMMAEFGGEINFVINGNMTFVYQNGPYLYLTDGSYYEMCYGYDKGTFKAGDTFKTLSGTYYYRYGQPQIKDYTIGEATPGQRVIQPMEIEGVDEIASYMINRYMTISGVTISDVNGKDATMTDAAGNSVALRDQFGINGFANGKNLTVTGFVALYKAANAEVATVQFCPTEIVNEAGEEIVEAPVFSLESGAYTENTPIEITCATEGATIWYTINDGDILEYSAPIALTEDMTISAYAAKEGMTDSDIVEAVYTVKPAEPVDETKAIFDFSASGFGKITCNPEITTYPNSNATNINDVEMTVNGVSITFTKGGNNNNALYASDNTLRIYTSNTLTVSVSDLFTITKITFTKGSSWAMTFPEGQSGTFDDAIWTAPAPVARAEEKISEVEFSASAKTFIKAIDVEFAKVSTGVEEVEVDEAVEAVYYNLQGVRVENPANGLYIRVAGKTASKVYIR